MTILKNILATSLLVVPLATAACGDDGSGMPGMGPDDDFDQDGFSINDGDCDDENRTIYPGAADPCDGIDQNCDGVADELFDQDNDNFTTCNGDCRDNDPTSNPSASEVVDGLDNDCDGIPDNHTPQYDDDGDGYSEEQGDCNDDPNGGGSLIGPGAIEVAENEDGEPEMVDNDCDGMVDEALEPCPEGVDISDPLALANAIDLCHEVISATRDDVNVDPRGQAIMGTFGDTYVPFTGADFAVLSTGLAGDITHPLYSDSSLGAHSANFNKSVPHPDPQPVMGTCGGDDSGNVQDISEFTLSVQVPSNAQAFSFDFNFMSIEFPEFVCSSFDDTFLAYLESSAFTGNVSFDSMGNRVSINVGFFDVCAMDPAFPTETAQCNGETDLVGTGFESTADEGGGTGWLTTTAPVVPGEKIKLTFAIFDEGDGILDSTVLIDNFRWEVEQVDGPVTIDKRVSTLEGRRDDAIELGGADN